MRTIVLSLGLGILGFACAGPTPPFDPKEAERARLVVAKLVEANDHKDLDTVMKCFGPDGALLTGEGKVVAGPEELERFHAELFRDFDPRVTWHSTMASARGDYATDHGTIEGELVSRTGKPNQPVKVRYLATLVRRGGVWQISTLQWSPADAAR